MLHLYIIFLSISEVCLHITSVDRNWCSVTKKNILSYKYSRNYNITVLTNHVIIGPVFAGILSLLEATFMPQ